MANITHVFFLLDFGGVERNIVNLSNAMVEEGHTVRVIISHRMGRMANLLHSDVETFILPPQRKLAALIDLLKFSELCHLHSNNLNPFFIWAASLANVPVIVNTIESSVQFPYSAYCDYLICPSYYIRTMQSRIRHIQVIYNGCDVENHVLPKRLASKDKIVLAEVRRPNKDMFFRLDQLIDALSATAGTQVEAWIIGEEGASTDKVKYFGVVPQPAEIVKKADFLVHLSKHDALPNAVIEAMAAGAIPIASAVGGIPEVVDHYTNGILVPTEQLSSKTALIDFISEILTQYLTERERFEEMRRQGIEKAERIFSKQQMVNQYGKLYETIILSNDRPNRSRLNVLLEDTNAEVTAHFLDLLEAYCFHPFEGADAIKKVDFDIFPPQQRAFLLGILAEHTMKNQQTPLAMQLLHYAVTLWDQDFYLNLNLGIALKMLNKLSQAEIYFRKAIQLMPDEIEPYLILLEIYMSQGKRQEAEALATDLLEKIPLNHPMRSTLSLLVQPNQRHHQPHPSSMQVMNF